MYYDLIHTSVRSGKLIFIFGVCMIEVVAVVVVVEVVVVVVVVRVVADCAVTALPDFFLVTKMTTTDVPIMMTDTRTTSINILVDANLTKIIVCFFLFL